MQLKGQTALVVNAAGPTGTAVARALAAAGAGLWLTDPDPGLAAALAGPLGAAALPCRPEDAESVAALVAAMPAPDIVVPVLTAGEDGMAAALPWRLMVEGLATALAGRGGGALIALALFPARPDPWQAAGAAWIAGAVRGLAPSLAQGHIRVHAVRARVDDRPALPRFMGGAANGQGPHLPAAGDIAAAVLALAAAGGMTGQVLDLDGGRGW